MSEKEVLREMGWFKKKKSVKCYFYFKTFRKLVEQLES